MPPKKDDKKKKGEGLTVKEVDPALYVRKVKNLNSSSKNLFTKNKIFSFYF